MGIRQRGRHRRPSLTARTASAAGSAATATTASAALAAVAISGPPAVAAARPAITQEAAFRAPGRLIFPQHKLQDWDTYTVVPGDSLSAISQARCSSAADWTGIYQANRSVIGGNPDLILPGQRLTLVCAAKMMTVTVSSQAGESRPAAAVPQQGYQGNVNPASYSGFQQCVIQRESGGNPRAVNPSSGAGGLYGFLPSTWQGLGFSGLPENAPVWEQDAAFRKAYAQDGVSPWRSYDGC